MQYSIIVVNEYMKNGRKDTYVYGCMCGWIEVVDGGMDGWMNG